MAKQHGKGSVIFVDEFDLSSHFNQVEVSNEISTAETTTFGAASSARTYVVGLRTGKVTASGYFDGAAGAVDESVSADLAGAAKRVITVGYAAAAVDTVAKLASSDYVSYGVSAPVDGAVTTSLDAQASNGPDSGRFLSAHAAVITTGDGTSVNNGAATTTGWVAHQHVTAVSGVGPTNTTKLQDSADDAAWLDVSGGAFSEKAAVGSERIVGTGTLRQYVRETHTIGGAGPSFTQVIAVARRPVA